MGKKRWLYTDIMVIGGSKKMYCTIVDKEMFNELMEKIGAKSNITGHENNKPTDEEYDPEYQVIYINNRLNLMCGKLKYRRTECEVLVLNEFIAKCVELAPKEKMYTKEEIKNVLLHFNTTASSKDVIDLLEFLY